MSLLFLLFAVHTRLVPAFRSRHARARSLALNLLRFMYTNVVPQFQRPLLRVATSLVFTSAVGRCDSWATRAALTIGLRDFRTCVDVAFSLISLF